VHVEDTANFINKLSQNSLRD